LIIILNDLKNEEIAELMKEVRKIKEEW